MSSTEIQTDVKLGTNDVKEATWKILVTRDRQASPPNQKEKMNPYLMLQVYKREKRNAENQLTANNRHIEDEY